MLLIHRCSVISEKNEPTFVFTLIMNGCPHCFTLSVPLVYLLTFLRINAIVLTRIITGTARIVCGTGSMRLSDARPFRPSVQSGRRTPLLRVCCCGPGGQQMSIDCPTVAPQNGAHQQMGAVSLCQPKLNADLLFSWCVSHLLIWPWMTFAVLQSNMTNKLSSGIRVSRSCRGNTVDSRLTRSEDC